jgi:DNA-binding transcriptional LysR family regulator
MRDKIEAQLAGLGVGYLPLHRIQPYLDSGDLVLVKLNQTNPPSSGVKAWRTGVSGNALAWFRERINEGVLGLDIK